METKSSWGIVGGGILGMSLALGMAQRGHKVTIFEAESSLGGLVSSFNDSNLVWDKYYHVILQSDTLTQGLLQDIKLAECIHWVKVKSGFYADGQFYSMSNIWEFLRFPLLSMWKKMRLGFTIYYASKIKNTHKLETQTIEEWLIRWSGKAAFNKIWLPLLRAKLGDAYKETSASFIQATISRMYSARNQGQKEEKFGYIPGGYATILRRFRDHLFDSGVHIKTSHPIQNVKTAHNSQISVTDINGKKDIFDQVVLTVPSPLMASLCPDLSEEEQIRLSKTPFLGIVCPSMLVKRPLSGFYITSITDTSIPFTALIEMTSLSDSRDYNGHSLVYLPKYVSSDDPLFEASDKKVEQEFTQAFLKMFPQLRQSDISSFRTAKNRYVFSPPQQNNGQSFTSIRTSVPGIYTVNSAFITDGTLNVNKTLALTERALDELLNETK